MATGTATNHAVGCGGDTAAAEWLAKQPVMDNRSRPYLKRRSKKQKQKEALEKAIRRKAKKKEYQKKYAAQRRAKRAEALKREQQKANRYKRVLRGEKGVMIGHKDLGSQWYALLHCYFHDCSRFKPQPHRFLAPPPKGQYDVFCPITPHGLLIRIGQPDDNGIDPDDSISDRNRNISNNENNEIIFVGYRRMPDGEKGQLERQRLLRVGDRIVAVDGVSTLDKTFAEVQQMFRESTRVTEYKKHTWIRFVADSTDDETTAAAAAATASAPAAAAAAKPKAIATAGPATTTRTRASAVLEVDDQRPKKRPRGRPSNWKTALTDATAADPDTSEDVPTTTYSIPRSVLLAREKLRTLSHDEIQANPKVVLWEGPPDDQLEGYSEWPDGWTKLITTRKYRNLYRTKTWWLSPKEKYKFDTRPKVEKFFRYLEQFDGDEQRAKRALLDFAGVW